MSDKQDPWTTRHLEVITDFVRYLNSKSDRFVLKGGTALLLCYGLNRFSEDIDLNGFGAGLAILVKSFCTHYSYTYRVAKSTKQVERYMINYGGSKPLKVESSFRDKLMEDTVIVDGILVYSINSLCVMKLTAYNNRDKLRDLYDIVFIGLCYYERLNSVVKLMLSQSLQFKGLDHYDYLVRTQNDPLINTDKLAADLLSLMARLGIL